MKRDHIAIKALIFAMTLIGTSAIFGQNREVIQATLQGTSTQMGRMVSVDIIINEHSTDEDQKVLIAAFQKRGTQGVANTLHKMHSKGRIRIPGTLGYDLNYIREFKLPNGSRKIRFVTDRPITFGESWASTRSKDYALSFGEIILAPDGGKSEGSIIPAGKIKIDKEKELSLEAYQNPWKLINIRPSN